MIFAHCKPAEPNDVFDDFRIMLITDIHSRLRSQSLLSVPKLAIQFVLAKNLERVFNNVENFYVSILSPTFIKQPPTSYDSHATANA